MEVRPIFKGVFFFCDQQDMAKKSRMWPTHTPFESARREGSIAGVFAVLPGKSFFLPAAGAFY